MSTDRLRDKVLRAVAARHGSETAERAALIQWPRVPRLLGESAKIVKGRKRGVLTRVMYLAPADESAAYGGANLCPWASAGCKAACLGHSSGRMVMDSSANARAWKSLLFLHARAEFKAILRAEILEHAAAAERKGLVAAVRLNGTSDIDLRAFGVDPDAPRFQAVRFYDYTKSAERAYAVACQRAAGKTRYHLTYSRSEDSRMGEMHDILKADGNVAVVFRGAAPAEWEGWPVVDGDEDDFRPWDPPGAIVALSVKGAVVDDTGFFV